MVVEATTRNQAATLQCVPSFCLGEVPSAECGPSSPADQNKQGSAFLASCLQHFLKDILLEIDFTEKIYFKRWAIFESL